MAKGPVFDLPLEAPTILAITTGLVRTPSLSFHYLYKQTGVYNLMFRQFRPEFDQVGGIWYTAFLSRHTGL